MRGSCFGFRGPFAGLVITWLVISLSAFAQTMRDPTALPASLGVAAGTDTPAGLVLEPGQIVVLQRDGTHYLVLGTRLYARGQTVGITKIERITETEVWLQENGSVRKVPVYGGITRRTAPTQPVLQLPPQGSPATQWLPGTEFEL